MIGGPRGVMPPPNWPQGVPFPPVPGGPGLQPISGNPIPGAQWHQQQLAAMQNQAAQHAAMQAFVQQQMTNWQPSLTAGQSGFMQAGQAAPSSPLMKPDPSQPDTLGWREWVWSDSDKMLKSPSQGTLWPEAELVVPDWDEADVVRGSAGIHAHLVPKHWKILGLQGGGYVASGDPMRVHGIVERFGKYVLGTEGWRAEWVIIKELMAPSTKVGLEIEKAYPDVVVHYPEDEGDITCTLVKSSALGKGNRSTSRPKPSPPPSPYRAVIQSGVLSPTFSQPPGASQNLLSPQNVSANSSQQMLPQDIGLTSPSTPNTWPKEAELKLGAIVFWGFVVLGIIAVAKCAG